MAELNAREVRGLVGAPVAANSINRRLASGGDRITFSTNGPLGTSGWIDAFAEIFASMSKSSIGFRSPVESRLEVDGELQDGRSGNSRQTSVSESATIQASVQKGSEPMGLEFDLERTEHVSSEVRLIQSKEESVDRDAATVLIAGASSHSSAPDQEAELDVHGSASLQLAAQRGNDLRTKASESSRSSGEPIDSLATQLDGNSALASEIGDGESSGDHRSMQRLDASLMSEKKSGRSSRAVRGERSERSDLGDSRVSATQHGREVHGETSFVNPLSPGDPARATARLNSPMPRSVVDAASVADAPSASGEKALVALSSTTGATVSSSLPPGLPLSGLLSSAMASIRSKTGSGPGEHNGTITSSARSETFSPASTASRSDDAATRSQRSASEMVARVRLVQRVSKAFQHLGPEGGSVRMRLAPAELGTVRVEMHVHNRRVQARVVAENEAASAALREHLPDLRARLESYGMQVERLEVETEAGDATTDSRQQADSRWQPPREQQRQGGRVTDPAALSGTPRDPAATVPGAVSSAKALPGRGVDVRL